MTQICFVWEDSTVFCSVLFSKDTGVNLREIQRRYQLAVEWIFIITVILNYYFCSFAGGNLLNAGQNFIIVHFFNTFVLLLVKELNIEILNCIYLFSKIQGRSSYQVRKTKGDKPSSCVLSGNIFVYQLSTGKNVDCYVKVFKPRTFVITCIGYKCSEQTPRQSLIPFIFSFRIISCV